ncbi:MAG: OB-fold nucleic acid binding domain-containing protein, partial [Chloroflexota bacterium]
MSERRRTPSGKGSRQLRPQAAVQAAAPEDPVELLGLPLGLCGVSNLAALRRPARKMGIDTVRDLLFHLPRRYDDLRELRTLRDVYSLDAGTVASVQVRVTGINVQQTWRRRVQVTTAQLTDGTETAEASWFGRRYIEKRLRPGDEILVSGRIKHRGGVVIFDGPEFQPADAANLLHVGRIVPVYRLTTGVTAVRLRAAMRTALDRAGTFYPEYLPDPIRAEHGLPPIAEALEAAHYPSTFEARDAALRRLAFDELLALQVGMVSRRRLRGRAHTTAVPVAPAADRRIRQAIAASISRKLGHDVDLTVDQAVALDEIRDDLARPVPMLRLVQGDVGSGKTAVA